MENELKEAHGIVQRVTVVASATPRLEKMVARLTHELSEARSQIQSLRPAKCIDFCVQVDSEVPRDLESLKKCEDLKRALHQSEKEKVAADAFSIKTKAEQHRITQHNAKIIFSSTWDHVPCSTLQRLSTSRIALEFILTIKAR